MLGVVLAVNLPEDAGLLAVRERLGCLGVPIASDARSLGLPMTCIWYVARSGDDAMTARSSGCNVILVDPADASPTQPDERGIYRVTGTEQILSLLSVPCTKALLELRHVLQPILGWGTPPV